MTRYIEHMAINSLCKFSVIVILNLFSIAVNSFAQKKHTISGYIRDNQTDESLNGASIRANDGSSAGTRSNHYGFYSLTLSEGKHTLLFSHIGFQPSVIHLLLERDTVINLSLSENDLLDEVVVTRTHDGQRLTNRQTGMTRVDITEMKIVPVLLGEKDVLKTIQLLPGIMSGGEGSSNFHVRGGAGDQNLILLDEATVYNASHLFGFFSTINSDAIKDVNLYKGGIPAQYGGRLASVLDIQMVDGNRRDFGGEGGVGLIASRLKLDGPIKGGNGSFMLSGRRTYADLFLRLSQNQDINKSHLYFYDLNAKANYRLDGRNVLFLSGYFGRDVMKYSNQFGFDWGNLTSTLRWNHLLTDRLFLNTTLIYSDYDYNATINNDDVNFIIASRISNYNLKQDLQYYTGNSGTVRFGIELLRQKIAPASIDADEGAAVNSLKIDKRNGTAVAAYLSHDWDLTDMIRLVYGTRINNFWLLGPGTFSQYTEYGNPTNTMVYSRGDVVKRYFNLEPRFSVNFQLDTDNMFKLAYNRNTQNLHQLSNSTSSLPTDAWVMSSNNIKPQIADQIATGYYRNFGKDLYEFSAEAYYKSMQNQIDYRNGADLQANKDIDGELLFGVGRAYGLELYLKKRAGSFQGWLSYTLSRSELRFEGINENHWFAARHDRTHDMAGVFIYQLTPRWTASATVVYSTGNAVTFPSGKYTVDGRSIWYYTERNGYRMPDYHRLDLGLTWKSEASSRFSSGWTFGIYNVYNRKNAYLIDFRQNEVDPKLTETYRIALFGIVPAITWNFKF